MPSIQTVWSFFDHRPIYFVSIYENMLLFMSSIQRPKAIVGWLLVVGV